MKPNILDPSDPFNMFKSAKPMKIEQSKQRKHDEANLHLSFCKWVKFQYPDAMFVRHEKEKARSHFNGNMMKVYNSLDGLPDFECMEKVGLFRYEYYGLYIEFKKPGEHWLEARTGLVKKAYQHQYECHVKMWERGRCAYFCNNLDDAILIFTSYMQGKPLPQQIYSTHPF